MSDEPLEGQEPELAEENPETAIGQFTEMVGGAEIAPEEAEEAVTIRTSTGQSFAAAVEEPTAIQDLFAENDLTHSRGLELYVDGSEVGWDHRVGPGSVVTAVGTVKGGK